MEPNPSKDRSILAKISNAPLLYQKFENCIRIYDQLILISFVVCTTELSMPKKCNRICNYSTVTIIVEKHVERLVLSLAN
jgi:hypothetical protein